MKVLTEPEPKFTDKVFTVEMTGAELAFIKAFSGRIIGDPVSSIRSVSSALYAGNPVKLYGLDGVVADLTETFDMSHHDLQPWLEKINHLNK